LVAAFGHAYELSALDRVNEALPPGFAAYTCVLHALIDDNGGRRRYAPPGALTSDVIHGVRRKLQSSRDGWTPASEGNLDEISAPTLTQILRISGSATDYIVIDSPWSIADGEISQLSGDELAEALDDRSCGPVLWFPESLAWIAATPCDAWETYVASSEETANEIRRHRDLETISCDWRAP
jgi:hypothetical protein